MTQQTNEQPKHVSNTARNVTFRQNFHEIWDAGSPFAWVSSAGDQGYTERQLLTACEEYQLPGGGQMEYHTWDIRNGCSDAELVPDPNTGEMVNKTIDPIEALQHIATTTGNSLYVMRDLHLLLNSQNNFALRRYLMDLCMANDLDHPDRGKKVIVVIADMPHPHSDIKHYCEVLEMPMPGYEEMKEDVVEFVRESVRENDPDAQLDCDDETMENIVNALLGLSAAEAERVLSRALLRSGGFNNTLPNHVAEGKSQSFKKIPGLEFTPRTRVGSPEDIGGFDLVIPYMQEVRLSFTRHAREVIELVPPSGNLLAGPGGTGKTLLGNLCAAMLDMDLIKLNLGQLLGGIVGESERNTRIAFAQIMATPRCVLLMDEMDKALGGSHKSQESDSGVGSRQLGEVLTHLQKIADRKDLQIFVIATVNRTENLPEELTRCGRFDKKWGVALPTKAGRVEIAKIHQRLKIKGMPVDALTEKQWTRLANATDKFTGAEIEQVIKDAHRSAFAVAMGTFLETNDTADLPTKEDCFPSLNGLLEAASKIKPHAITHADELQKMMAFCENNTDPVCSAELETPAKRNKRNVNITGGSPEAN